MALQLSELATVKQMMASQQIISRASKHSLAAQQVAPPTQCATQRVNEFETFFATFNFKQDPVFGEDGIYPDRMPNSVEMYLKAAAESLTKVELVDAAQSEVLAKIINFLASLSLAEQEQRTLYMNSAAALQKMVIDLQARVVQEHAAADLERQRLQDKNREITGYLGDIEHLRLKIFEFEKLKDDEQHSFAGMMLQQQQHLQEIASLKEDNQRLVREANSQMKTMVGLRNTFEDLRRENNEMDQLILQLQNSNNDKTEEIKLLGAELSLLRAKFENLTAERERESQASVLEKNMLEQQLRETSAQLVRSTDLADDLQAQLTQSRAMLKAKLNRHGISRQQSKLSDEQLSRLQGGLTNLRKQPSLLLNQASAQTRQSSLNPQDSISLKMMNQWVGEQIASHTISNAPSSLRLGQADQPQNAHDDEQAVSGDQDAERPSEDGAKSAGSGDAKTDDNYCDEVLNSSSSELKEFIDASAYRKISVSGEGDARTARFKAHHVSTAAGGAQLAGPKKAHRKTMNSSRTERSEPTGELPAVDGQELPALSAQVKRRIVRDDKEVQTVINMTYIAQLIDDVQKLKSENALLQGKVARLNRKLQAGPRQSYKMADDAKGSTVQLEFEEQKAQEELQTALEDLKTAQRDVSTAPEPTQAQLSTVHSKQLQLLRAKMRAKERAVKRIAARNQPCESEPEAPAGDGREQLGVKAVNDEVLSRQMETVKIAGEQNDASAKTAPQQYNLDQNSDFKDQYGIRTKIDPQPPTRPILEAKSQSPERRKQNPAIPRTGEAKKSDTAAKAPPSQPQKGPANDALVIKPIYCQESRESRSRQLSGRKLALEATVPKQVVENPACPKSEKAPQSVIQASSARSARLGVEIKAQAQRQEEKASVYPEVSKNSGAGPKVRYGNPLKHAVEFRKRQKQESASKVAQFLAQTEQLADAAKTLWLRQPAAESQALEETQHDCDEDSGAFEQLDRQFQTFKTLTPEEAATQFKMHVFELIKKKEKQKSELLSVKTCGRADGRKSQGVDTQKTAQAFEKPACKQPCTAGQSPQPREAHQDLYTCEALLSRSENIERELASQSLQLLSGGPVEKTMPVLFAPVEATLQTYKNAFRCIGELFSIQLGVSIEKRVEKSVFDNICANYYPILNDNATAAIFGQEDKPIFRKNLDESKDVTFLRVLPEFRPLIVKLQGVSIMAFEDKDYVVCGQMRVKSLRWTEQFCRQLYSVATACVLTRMQQLLRHPERDFDILGVLTSYLQAHYGLPFLARQALLFLLASCYAHKARSSMVELFYLLLTNQFSNQQLVFLSQAEEQLRGSVPREKLLDFCARSFYGLRDAGKLGSGLPADLNADQQRLALVALFSLNQTLASVRLLELYEAVKTLKSDSQLLIVRRLAPHLQAGTLERITFRQFMDAIAFAPQSAFDELKPSVLLRCAQNVVLVIVSELGGNGSQLLKPEQQSLLQQCYLLQDTIQRKNGLEAYLEAMRLLAFYQQLLINSYSAAIREKQEIQ